MDLTVMLVLDLKQFGQSALAALQRKKDKSSG